MLWGGGVNTDTKYDNKVELPFPSAAKNSFLLQAGPEVYFNLIFTQ